MSSLSHQPPAEAGQTLINILAPHPDLKVKASSGTSKAARSILDGSAETCWTCENQAPNSDPSTVFQTVTFKLVPLAEQSASAATEGEIKSSRLHSISFVFAGGFSPISIKLLGSSEAELPKTWFTLSQELYPIDSNAKQWFNLAHTQAQTGEEEQDQIIRWLRLELNGSTDDYGRLTVYQTEVFVAV